VNVYYNPNNPNRSVLEPRFPFSMLLPLLVGGVFLAAGILGLTGHEAIWNWRF